MTTDELRQEAAAEDALRKAQETFTNIRAALEDGAAAMQAATDTEKRAYNASVGLFWKALTTIDDREKDLETLRRERAGIANGYALDLAQARGEVGRRLACLAAAAQGEGLSGGA